MFCPTVSQNVAESASWSLTESAAESATEDQSFSVLAEVRQDVRVGKACYRFIRPARINYLPADRGWICYVSGLTSYLGNGETPEQAFEELKVRIHTAFQTLLTKRPFEMDEDEHSRWVELTSVIDLLHYKTTTPVTTYEIGQVSFAKVAHPHLIKWINGTRYRIDPHKVPGELMSYRPGQWIDAVVRRDPVSHTVVEIESVRRISFRVPRKSELKAAWEAMPEAKLEPTEWAW